MTPSKNVMDVIKTGILNALSNAGTPPSRTGYQLDSALSSLLHSFLVSKLSFPRINSMSACKSGSLPISEGIRKEILYLTLKVKYRDGDSMSHLSRLMKISTPMARNIWEICISLMKNLASIKLSQTLKTCSLMSNSWLS